MQIHFLRVQNTQQTFLDLYFSRKLITLYTEITWEHYQSKRAYQSTQSHIDFPLLLQMRRKKIDCIALRLFRVYKVHHPDKDSRGLSCQFVLSFPSLFPSLPSFLYSHTLMLTAFVLFVYLSLSFVYHIVLFVYKSLSFVRKWTCDYVRKWTLIYGTSTVHFKNLYYICNVHIFYTYL